MNADSLLAKPAPKGLIDRICDLGVERAELCREAPRAVVGGHRIPYRPVDLAAIITLLNVRKPKHYLALETHGRGGIEFIGATIGGLYLSLIKEENKREADLRTHLRKMDDAFDVVTLDGRGLTLDAETLWRYLEGGKEPPVREFGKGAQMDYGRCKLKPSCVIILNLADPATKLLYFRLRMRYTRMYSSSFVGVVHI